MEREVKPFTMWRHFKGARSFVITIATHSETGEKLVVYRCMDNNGKTNHKDGIYARPRRHPKIPLRRNQRLIKKTATVVAVFDYISLSSW